MMESTEYENGKSAEYAPLPRSVSEPSVKSPFRSTRRQPGGREALGHPQGATTGNVVGVSWTRASLFPPSRYTEMAR
jgi:hypothetical protein